MEPRELDASRRTVSTKSGEISYIDIGTGPAALFVHGVGTNAYLWRNVLGPLAAVRRCLAIDLPLHGQTPVAAGQDLSVAALASVLEDFCDALELTGIDLAAAGDLAPAMAALMEDIGAARDAAFGSAYEHPADTDPAVIRAYLEPCVGTPERAREFERLLVALDSRDLEAVQPQLRTLQVPTLLVWGTDDPFFDISWAHWLRDTIPGVTKLVTVDGGKLFFPEERPGDLVGPLTEHWAAHPRA